MRSHETFLLLAIYVLRISPRAKDTLRSYFSRSTQVRRATAYGVLAEPWRAVVTEFAAGTTRRGPATALDRHPSPRAPAASRPFSHHSIPAIREELLRFGRRRAHENINLAPLIDELIARHFDPSRHVLVTDACYLAHNTGLYDRCVELFSTCARESSLDLHLLECVVDSCYHLGEELFLRKLFEIVDLMAARIRQDGFSQIGVLRAFWRCVVAIRNAEHMLHEARLERRREKPLHIGVTDYRDACQKLYALLLNSAPTETTAIEGSAKSNISLPPFEDALREVMRCVRYASCGDDGESAFYRRFIFRHFVLRDGVCAIRNINLRPVVFGSLIRSTQRGHQLGIAREYFHYCCSLWTEEQTPVEESVVHAYLQTLANDRAFDGIAEEAASLLLPPKHHSSHAPATQLVQRKPYVPSNSVVALIVRAAGELKKLDLCLQCVDILLAGSSGDKDHTPPSPYEMFSCLIALAKCTAPNFFQILQLCTVDSELIKLTEEELLYIRLQYIRNSVDARERIEQIQEVILLDYNNNNDSDRDAVLTLRNKNLILHILQTCDSDCFVTVLRCFCSKLGSLAKAEHSWASLALFWAEGRRHRMSKADREFFQQLLSALDMNDVSSPRAEPYRLALMNFQALTNGADEPPQSFAFRCFTKCRYSCLELTTSSTATAAGPGHQDLVSCKDLSDDEGDKGLARQLMVFELAIRQSESKMEVC